MTWGRHGPVTLSCHPVLSPSPSLLDTQHSPRCERPSSALAARIYPSLPTPSAGPWSSGPCPRPWSPAPCFSSPAGGNSFRNAPRGTDESKHCPNSSPGRMNLSEATRSRGGPVLGRVAVGGSQRGGSTWLWSSQIPAGGSYPLHGDGCLHLGGHGVHPGRHPEPVEPLVLLADGIFSINPGTLHVLLLQGLARGEPALREPPGAQTGWDPRRNQLSPAPEQEQSPGGGWMCHIPPADPGGEAGVDLPLARSHRREQGIPAAPSAEHRQDQPHAPFSLWLARPWSPSRPSWRASPAASL